ncbi:Acyl-CoA dehydrogenase [Aquisphaera giovannonii]|uniref:Acyl-CoA dehydrogenase n=1 Tax=Aquisphaera giovannonii TaxID=406548 RepID=A0A5B9W4L1_9BACT|nr:acyl-CoA dehydrogenase family protein [Aquisphaera giovannonii]QEH35055.1 Acyl-CoA dehydrogenase [Aquisphaera giovannonii]
MTGDPLVDRAHELASRFLAPRAALADRAAGPPVEQVRHLAESGLLGLTTPPECGGLGASRKVVRDALAAVASGCGVTAFVCYQHLVGCRHLAGCGNGPLKDRLLPDLAAGRRFCSLAFSHIRRPGPPILRARADGDDWVFDGTAPWMTGWGLADDVLLAGVLPDGRSAWALAPLVEGESLRPSPPAHLCAMDASATVSLECRGLRVGPDRQVKAMTPAELAADTAGANLFFTSLSVGVTLAAIGLLRAIGPDAPFADAADALGRELARARAAVDRWDDPATPAEGRGDVTALRAHCIDLGVRASYAAVVASGGAANGLDHPAQRLYREAMVYSLVAQTRDLRVATLDRLVRPGASVPG